MSDELDLFDMVRNTLPYQLGFDEGYKRGLEGASKIVEEAWRDGFPVAEIPRIIRAKIQEKDDEAH